MRYGLCIFPPMQRKAARKQQTPPQRKHWASITVSQATAKRIRAIGAATHGISASRVVERLVESFCQLSPEEQARVFAADFPAD